MPHIQVLALANIDKLLQDAWDSAEILNPAGPKLSAYILQNGSFWAQSPTVERCTHQVGDCTGTWFFLTIEITEVSTELGSGQDV